MELSVLLEAVTSIFGSVVGMVGTVVTTVTENPILTLFALIPLAGIVVGMFKRLINVN